MLKLKKKLNREKTLTVGLVFLSISLISVVEGQTGGKALQVDSLNLKPDYILSFQKTNQGSTRQWGIADRQFGAEFRLLSV